jgi:hypothetical protein
MIGNGHHVHASSIPKIPFDGVSSSISEGSPQHAARRIIALSLVHWQAQHMTWQFDSRQRSQ